MGSDKVLLWGVYRFGTDWRRSEKRAHRSSSCRSGEGVDDAPRETNFKTKASKQGPAGIGGRWIVTVTLKRRVRSPEWAGGHANPKDRG